MPVVGPAVEATQVSYGIGDTDKLGVGGRGVLLVGSAGELKLAASET